MVYAAWFSVVLALGMAQPGARQGDFAKKKPALGDAIPDVGLYDSEGKPFQLSGLNGNVSVLVFGCLTCPPFLRNVSRLETVYRDFQPQGVQFVYVYKSLAHPGLDGYVTPFTLEERLLHVREAKRTLGSDITWLVDTMTNDAKHAFGDAPNCEFVFDENGLLFGKRLWSDPEALREDLTALVGAVSNATTVDDLDLKPTPEKQRKPARVVPRLDVPWGMRALTIEPGVGEDGLPFYVKLRAEAERALLDDGGGRLYLGFFLDPLHQVHWNNKVAPMRFELDVPAGVTVSQHDGFGPKVDAEADVGPREFLIDVSGWRSGAPLGVEVHYFACDDAETFCIPVSQSYAIHPKRDPDGGRRLGAGMRGGIIGQLLAHDANGDGRIDKDELPERLQARLTRFDTNTDGSVDDDELRQATIVARATRGRGGMLRRLMEFDADEDGRIERAELPPEMEQLREGFDRFDLDGDGFIEGWELERMTQPRSQRRRR